MEKINIPLKTVCLFYSMYVILNTQGQGVSHRVQGVSFCKLFSLYIILNTQGTGGITQGTGGNTQGTAGITQGTGGIIL